MPCDAPLGRGRGGRGEGRGFYQVTGETLTFVFICVLKIKKHSLITLQLFSDSQTQVFF